MWFTRRLVTREITCRLVITHPVRNGCEIYLLKLSIKKKKEKGTCDKSRNYAEAMKCFLCNPVLIFL